LDDNGQPVWAGYRTDLVDVSTGKKPKFELRPHTSGLAMGSKPDSKGDWIPVKGGFIRAIASTISNIIHYGYTMNSDRLSISDIGERRRNKIYIPAYARE
jgi:hypothetical protein